MSSVETGTEAIFSKKKITFSRVERKKDAKKWNQVAVQGRGYLSLESHL